MAAGAPNQGASQVQPLPSSHAPVWLVAEFGADVDPFNLHLFTALAEKERAPDLPAHQAALKAAKARGTRLGNPNLRWIRGVGKAALKAAAERFAANLLPIIREAQKAGARSLRDIVEVLNARGVRTARREVGRDAGPGYFAALRPNRYLTLRRLCPASVSDRQP